MMCNSTFTESFGEIVDDTVRKQVKEWKENNWIHTQTPPFDIQKGYIYHYRQ